MDRENRNAILWERKKLKECFKFPLRILKLMPPEEWSLNDIQRVNDLWEKYGGKVTDTEIAIPFCREKVNDAILQTQKLGRWSGTIFISAQECDRYQINTDSGCGSSRNGTEERRVSMDGMGIRLICG